MNYLTDADQTILLAVVVGLCSGIVMNLQDLALKRWIEKNWISWEVAISELIAKTAIQAIIYGAVAFVILLYDTQNTLAAINRMIVLSGIGLGLFFIPAIRAVGRLILNLKRAL